MSQRNRNRDDIDRFHDYGIYLPNRTLYMGSEIVGEDEESGTDALMAERMVKNLHILDAEGSDIVIIMNNLGGDVMHGLAIYDAIRACKSKVIIKAFGNAMSMGSVILQAADERIMAPNSVQMIHIGSVGSEGHAKTVYRQIEEAKRLDKLVDQIYLEKIREKHPDFTPQRLKGMLDHDTFLTAKQSVELGLADKVLGE
jgi:ATP-dependent Clp protease protease subunit